MSFTKYRYTVFGILGLAYILVFFHRLAPAVVAVDMMADLKTGGALMGFLASAYFYPYGIMQIPAGLLSDSWGPRRSVVVFFTLGSIGSFALGFAHSVSTAIACRVLVGLGVAMIFIPTLKILTQWFESTKFSRMTGLFMSLGGIGAFSASTPLALLSDAITWRGSMIVIGILTLGVALLVWLMVRDTPEEAGFPSVEKFNEANLDENRKLGLMEGIFLVIKNKFFWPIALSSFFGSMVMLSFSGLWGGPFLMHVYGMTRTQAGGVLSMMAIGLIFGAPAWNWLSHHVFHSRKKGLMISQCASMFIFAPLAFYTADFTSTQLYIWCFLFNFSMTSMVVIGYSSIKDFFPLQISGTATGLLNIFPFAGAALGQPLIGWFLDIVGPRSGPYSADAYSMIFKACLVCLLLAFISGAMMKETFFPRST